MALGHPLAPTGAILTCKALSYLEHTGGRYGMVTMCIGGGMGAAGYRAPVRRRSQVKVRRIVDDGPPHLFFKVLPPRLCLAGRILRLFPADLRLQARPCTVSLLDTALVGKRNASPFQAPFVLY